MVSSVQHEGFKLHFALTNTVLAYSVADERYNAHNKYYHAKIYKQGKLVKVKAPHKQTANNIY